MRAHRRQSALRTSRLVTELGLTPTRPARLLRLAGPYAGQIAAASPTNRRGDRAALQNFVEAECDGLIFFPCAAEPAQVQLLADCVR